VIIASVSHPNARLPFATQAMSAQQLNMACAAVSHAPVRYEKSFGHFRLLLPRHISVNFRAYAVTLTLFCLQNTALFLFHFTLL
jgi:hypothetical protein